VAPVSIQWAPPRNQRVRVNNALLELANQRSESFGHRACVGLACASRSSFALEQNRERDAREHAKP
jgi:hypothetical protein